MTQPGGEYRRGDGQHGNLVRVDAPATEDDGPEAAGIAHALALPARQRQAADSQHKQRRDDKNETQLPHGLSRHAGAEPRCLMV
jgi:hypothetical protein